MSGRKKNFTIISSMPGKVWHCRRIEDVWWNEAAALCFVEGPIGRKRLPQEHAWHKNEEATWRICEAELHEQQVGNVIWECKLNTLVRKEYKMHCCTLFACKGTSSHIFPRWQWRCGSASFFLHGCICACRVKVVKGRVKKGDSGRKW